ncbi:DUF3488 and transglutaminase-like domain-containing protein [Yinghuangia sp. ASG 101]|uniref:DUF3488 and transglutaminase-like domain-containing protein n=1 Tax=Yinghuangia sp. ASG 101 TaxID=2896848 RepID=UPI001E5C0373|nr:transglutaminase domain-containing protein [Yinghuangia sp. ASG 101]UGQ12289.1 DUF3488 and transglutaminase-like domain-containing protein [Yinghuangia sp. ASG 101]
MAAHTTPPRTAPEPGGGTPPRGAAPPGQRGTEPPGRARESAATLREILAPATVVVLAVFVGLMFHRVFGLTAVLLPTAVAAVVPAVLVAVLCRGPRVPATVSATVSVVVAAVAGTAAYARDRAFAAVIPTPGSLAALAGDLADAPREILTTVLPVTRPGGSAVLVPACVWAASGIGTELLFRTRLAALALVPPTLLFLGAALLATGAPGTSLPLVAGFAAAVGLFLAVREARRPTTTALAGLLALALAVPAALGALALPGGTRHAFDPRGHVDPPAPTTVRGPNPLAYVSAWLQNPETLMFTDAGSTPPPGGTLYRLTVFDHYDGVSWAPVERFLPSGGRVPEPESGRGSAGPEVEQDITVAELPGVFLPAVERPTEVRDATDAFAVDPDAGVLASATPLRNGTNYRVTSRPSEHDPTHTEFAAAGDTASALELPAPDGSGASVPVVDELRAYAQEATAGAQFPYQQALRLASWLRGHAVSDPQAIPGHSYRHIQYFLGTSHQGTSEQFATAFALMARTLALPTRVVVGFRAEGGSPEGVTRVRGGDVLVWAEVEFAGEGWVPFFPTPGAGSATSAVAPPTEEVTEPVPVPGEAVPPGDPKTGPARDDVDRAIENRGHAPPSADHAGAGGSGVRAAVLVPATAGTVLAAYAALALGGPAWLRRRRTRGSPRARIAGAWEQVVDDVAGIGPPLPPGATTGDVVAHARTHAGAQAAESAAVVASAADGVAFGDVDPSDSLADACACQGRLLRGHLKAVTADTRLARLTGRLRPRSVAGLLAAARRAVRRARLHPASSSGVKPPAPTGS